VKPAVRGIQDQGVMANVKHFINNNQETDRGSFPELSAMDAIVDERTEWEVLAVLTRHTLAPGRLGNVRCSHRLRLLRLQMYLQPFIGAVEAGVATFMCSCAHHNHRCFSFRRLWMRLVTRVHRGLCPCR
jgi:hypothetical protein